MKTKMLIVAVGVALVATSPALARSKHHHVSRSRHASAEFAAAPRVFAPSYNVYSSGGAYLGRDPDPAVRFQLRREGEWWEGPN